MILLAEVAMGGVLARYIYIYIRITFDIKCDDQDRVRQEIPLYV